MKRFLALVLLITILASMFSLTSCNSGAKALGERLEEMGFVENPADAIEEVTRGLLATTALGYEEINDMLNVLIEQGNIPRLWQKGDDVVTVIECTDVQTVIRIQYNIPDYNAEAVRRLKENGSMYRKCFIVSAPDYVRDEIIKMNGIT